MGGSPKNKPSFHLVILYVPQFILSFASQKRPFAFYSLKDIFPFNLNLKDIAYLKKVYKSVQFFAGLVPGRLPVSGELGEGWPPRAGTGAGFPAGM